MILALLASAHAFCGAYVGDGSSTLTNRASQIVMAQDEGATTLTMFNDYIGSLSDFGLVVPVPPGIDEDNIRVVSRDLLAKVADYSAPRMVAYTCDDLYGISDAAQAADTGFGNSSVGMSFGCGSSNNYMTDASMDSASPAALDSTGVIIEEQFDLAEYTVFVLSADGGNGLSAWLTNNGFSVSEGTQALFDEYIDSGSQFLALKVDITDVVPGEFLSPLQLHYPSQGWSLPIRMGALNSAGVQDLVVYMLSSVEGGTVGVSNYPENPGPQSECMPDLGEQAFSDWYENQLEASTGLPDTPEELSGQSGLAWITEYSWASGACDPCTSMGPLTDIDVNQLGYLNTHLGWQFTRLHFRYTPDTVTKDLVFYNTRQNENSQRRYVQHAWELESSFPMCGETQPVEPGECYSAEYWARRATGQTTEVIKTSSPESGCKSSGLAFLFVPLVAIGLRRRE